MIDPLDHIYDNAGKLRKKADYDCEQLLTEWGVTLEDHDEST